MGRHFHLPPAVTGQEIDSKFSESLEGLRVIQIVRPTVFNFVAPKLLKTPMPLNAIRCEPRPLVPTLSRIGT